MQTPRASPCVELPPTRALTEPALALLPPPTNVSVGPLSNSFESAMMQVDTTTMQTFEYPAQELSAPPIDTLQPSSSRSSTDPPTSVVEALLRGLSSQLSSITSRLDRLEQPQPKPYSPSIQASLWAPPRTSRPIPGQPGYSAHDEPTEDLEYNDLNALPSSMDNAGDYFHDFPVPESQLANPNWPDAYLTELYHTCLGLPADQDLMGSQNEFALSLPGIFLLYCNETNTS